MVATVISTDMDLVARCAPGTDRLSDDEFAGRLTTAVTEAVVSVCGESSRENTWVVIEGVPRTRGRSVVSESFSAQLDRGPQRIYTLWKACCNMFEKRPAYGAIRATDRSADPVENLFQALKDARARDLLGEYGVARQ
jgi:hypothetical protein